MPFLNLFGVRIAITETGSIEKASFESQFARIKVREWRCSVRDWKSSTPIKTAKIQWWLEIEEAHTLFTLVHFRIVEKAGGEWFPDDGPHAQSQLSNEPGSISSLKLWGKRFKERLPERQGLSIESGAFNIDLSFEDDCVSGRDDRLFFKFPPKERIVDGEFLPLAVETGNAGGLTFNLRSPQPELIFEAAALTGESRVLVKKAGAPTTITFLSEPLTSRPASFNLSQPIKHPELQLIPARLGAMLPLHCELKTEGELSSVNPLLVPIYAMDYALRVQLSRASDNGMELSEIVLRGADIQPLKLRTLGLADTHNRPITWRVDGNINLHVRITEDSARPTTFLIAPTEGGVSLEREGSGAIHGNGPSSRFFPKGQGKLFSKVSPPTIRPPVNVRVSKSIISDMASPRVSFQGEQSFEHPKPGSSYVLSTEIGQLKSVEAEPYKFAGKGLALPLLPVEIHKLSLDSDLMQDTKKWLNAKFGDQAYELSPTRHETGLLEHAKNPNDVVRVRPLEVFPLETPNPREEVGQIRLKSYTSIRNLGPVKVKVDVEEKKPLDYILITNEDDFDTAAAEFNFQLDEFSAEFRLKKSRPQKKNGLPRAILKLSNQITLEDIFEIEKDKELKSATVLQHIDSTVRKEKEWVGIIMFSVPIDADPSGPLAVLTPKNLELVYLAVPPQKNNRFSLSARAIWCREPTNGECLPGQDQIKFSDKEKEETAFRLNSLDIAWYDRRLNFYHADADFSFKSFFGLQFSPTTVKILGSYDGNKKQIRFIGQFKDSRPLFPAGFTAGPIKQVFIKSAEIKFVEGQTAIHFDGSIDLQKVDPFKIKTPEVEFKGLQVKIPGNIADGLPHLFEIEYPSLRFDPKIPPFQLGFLEAKLGSFTVDWDGPQFAWEKVIMLPGGEFDPEKPSLRFDLRLELMKLPELAIASVDRLILDFTIAFIKTGPSALSAKPRIGIKGAAFEKLKIDLMRFLTIEAERASFEQVDVDTGVGNQKESVTWLKLEAVKLTILNKKIIDELTVAIFSGRPNRRGFLGYVFPGEAARNAILDIHWVLIGQNIELEDGLARRIMQVKAPKEINENKRIATDLAASINSLVPRNPTSKHGEWIFAGGFTFFEVLEGKFLFQDNAYYGICLDGPLLKQWFGYDIGISVLYIKGQRPGQDTFVTSIRVPQVTFPEFTFMGGVVSIEIVMDGGFTLDIGFPWLAPGGSRQWERMLGAIVFPYQGTGGFYIKKRNIIGDISEGTQKGLCLSGGYALQAGLGYSSESRNFRVWATVGVFYILEGTVYLRDGKLIGGRLSGANGLVGRGAGELNWWVISVRIEILISAESRATLSWGTLCDGSTAAAGRTKLDLDFEFFAGVTASACIGSGWFKVCKSIEVHTTLRFHQTIFLS